MMPKLSKKGNEIPIDDYKLTKEERILFNNSFKNKQYTKAISMVLGLNLMFDMYDKGKLKSEIAKANIKAINDTKEIQIKNYIANAVSNKNHQKNHWAKKTMLINHSKTVKLHEQLEQTKAEHYEMIAYNYNLSATNNIIDSINNDVVKLLK